MIDTPYVISWVWHVRGKKGMPGEKRSDEANLGGRNCSVMCSEIPIIIEIRFGPPPILYSILYWTLQDSELDVTSWFLVKNAENGRVAPAVTTTVVSVLRRRG